jgi:thymidylate synthase (FAD)
LLESKVKLVGITKPVNNPACETAEDLVAYAARVSNPGNQNNMETAPKLLGYLIKHKHWSPLEMVHVCMEIETPRDIARQILRHRSFAFQEFSQRYAVAQEFVLREPRLQDTKNRQNSVEVDPKDLDFDWERAQRRVLVQVNKEYEAALAAGIAKEQARAILPEGLTMSRLYMSGSLRSWIHYCDLRRANGTQKEHMEVAELCWNVIKDQFPSCSEASQGS